MRWPSKEDFETYYHDPFLFFDTLTPSFRGHIFNPFLKFRLQRRIAFFMAILLGLIPWILFGFDSCIAQPMMMLYRIPALLTNQITYETWLGTWSEYYGKEMHYSAFLIYGLMYWALSRHFDVNLGIKRSKNVLYSASLTFLSIALFEFYWMGSYATFQNQPWVISPRWPQLRIIFQNLAFLIVGVGTVVYIWADSYILEGKKIVGRTYTFNLNRKALLLIGLSIGLALLWIYYPGYVERITVTLETGETWSNTSRFPQTLYTIDMNPNDNVNAGEWFFLENNMVHGLNTLVKVVWTFTIFYIGKLKVLNMQRKEYTKDEK